MAAQAKQDLLHERPVDGDEVREEARQERQERRDEEDRREEERLEVRARRRVGDEDPRVAAEETGPEELPQSVLPDSEKCFL